jgi:hypothetical protein
MLRRTIGLVLLGFTCGFVLHAAEPACQPYTPGHGIGWDAYADLYNAFFNDFNGGNFGGAMADMDRWNNSLDAEMTPALYTVFTDPESGLFLASFSDPDARFQKGNDGKPVLNANGEPVPSSFDRGQGLRVVWQLVPKAKGQRLLSVISFWQFDAQAGEPRLVPGFDSLRIRSQLTDFVPSPEDADPGQGVPNQDPGHGFAGLSYATTFEKGEMTSLVPSPPVALSPYSGDPALHRNITGAALPVACASCHRDQAIRTAYQDPSTDAQTRRRAAFLDYVKGTGISDPKLRELEKNMRQAEGLRRLFLPRGVLSTLSRKCAAG